MKGEAEVSRCKFLRMEWINNKVLLYSTENYIQYSMIKHNGKEDIKRMCIKKNIYIYVYITESLCCTAEINAKL